MRKIGTIVLCAALATGAIPSPSIAQRGGGGGPSFRGDWRPVVGAGAVYQYEEAGQPAMTWEVACVGQEGSAYWIETRLLAGQEMITKMLIAPAHLQRLIVKSGREPAMEVPIFAGMSQAPQTDLTEAGRLVGQETVTTPAGSFPCDHYQASDRGKTVDAWVNPQVSPYGIVKVSGPGISMVLQKTLSGVRTRITEAPQKVEIPSMQERMGGERGRSY